MAGAAAAAAPLSLVCWCTATILYEEQLVDGVSEFRGEREESTGGLVCCHARSEEGKKPLSCRTRNEVEKRECFIRTVRGKMESVLRLKVRAIGTGAGSWKPNWEGAGAGAGVGSWGALSFFLP